MLDSARLCHWCSTFASDELVAHLWPAALNRDWIRSGVAKVLIVFSIACHFYRYLREPRNVQRAAEALFTLASEQQIPPEYVAQASVSRGWAIAEQGRTDEGIALIRAGLNPGRRLGLASFAQMLSPLSEEQARAGNFEAFTTIEQALSEVGEQQLYLPNVLWWRGELHLKCGDETKAADDFREAIAVARRIGSKASELRATTSLARLLVKQGKRDEARAMLAEIYNQFTEGFDTADLKDAKALLDELGE
jgi:tetratricopeptide (TPR) repeat protein